MWPARFVPGHPIAGSEQSGVEASNAELFRRHKVILTPQASTDAAALWVLLGDLVIAGLKQLDHIAYIRYAIVYLQLNDLHEIRNEINHLLEGEG